MLLSHQAHKQRLDRLPRSKPPGQRPRCSIPSTDTSLISTPFSRRRTQLLLPVRPPTAGSP
ncbi:hypothetical protein T484DRAFT_1926105 [Baffinella frigidus]|nr:hypothetical protein T484DRAFT_1926105 [Cryptophyta sp. CCMP2293]